MRSVVLRVSGKTLLCSHALWGPLLGPKPSMPMEWESDGCSGGSPDNWITWTGRRFKLWPACVIHDFHYRYTSSLGVGAGGRKRADSCLYHSLHKLVRLQGGSRFTAHRIAWLYWGRVRIWGVDSWQHWGEEKPEGFIKRVTEAYWTGD